MRAKHNHVGVPLVSGIDDRCSSLTHEDFRGVVFRDCDMRGMKITDSWLVDVNISGLIGAVIINDVDVTDFVEAELDRITHPASAPPSTPDLRDRLWCSIDNDDTRDIDQLTVSAGAAARLLAGRTRLGNQKLVSRQDGIRAALGPMREGRPLYYLPDRDYGPRGALFVPFFGVPAATMPRMASHSSLRLRGSSPVVGSSSSSSRGRPTRLAPRSRRRRMPPE